MTLKEGENSQTDNLVSEKGDPLYTLSNGQKTTKRRWKILVALDIKNAFNSASWKIIEAMKRKEILTYLIALVESYLYDRKIKWGKDLQKEMTIGVPQGSVLGPTLWKMLYEEILNIQFEDDEIKTIAYADDLALYVESNDINRLKQMGNEALNNLKIWLEENELSLATAKTKMIILQGPRKGNTIWNTLDNIRKEGLYTVEDPVDMFFKSLTATAKTLSLRNLAAAK